VTVLSGGARGIDTAAHEGALDADGKTVVVAPTWFEHPYPEENRGLYEQVLDSGGSYVTPTEAADQRPHPRLFFLRNAVLVAYADAVVVVEAAYRSGARNAAKWARLLQKPLYAVPHAPWDGMGSGCLDEIAKGARVLTRGTQLLKDVLNQQGNFSSLTDFGSAPRPSEVAPRGRLPKENRHRGVPSDERGNHAAQAGIAAALKGLESGEELLRGVVEAESLTAAQICDRSGLPADEVQTLLLTLTLQGVLVCSRSGRYRAAGH